MIRLFLSVSFFAKVRQPVKINTTAVIKKHKKLDKELTNLKQMLKQKEPNASQSLYEQYHHSDIYKRIDTDLESFFYKRDYNVNNFNFLINLLSAQTKQQQIPQVVDKMELLKIYPNEKTYNYLIRAASLEGDIAKAEEFFKVACKKFRASNYFYTSLMLVYLKQSKPTQAYNILQEMLQIKLQPDLPVYTTLINSLRVGRQLEKCWQLHAKLVKRKVDFDETYIGVMLKVYAATHNAERAMILYKQYIVDKRVQPMIETVNSYLKVLGSRPEYASMAIDKFFDLVEKGEIINAQTIRWALKASSTSGNLKSAIQIVKVMKNKQIEANKQIYNSLIRVYTKATDLLHISQSHIEVILMDTWKLLEEVIAKGMLDSIILNNVMEVFANALKQDKIQGLILPLFDKYGLEMNAYSYEILVDLYYKKTDFKTALRIWEQMKVKLKSNWETQVQKQGKYQTNMTSMKEDLRPTFNLLELYIQMGIRLMDMNMIMEALDIFKKLKRCPKNSTLKYLGNLKGLPEEIQVSLMDFNIRFGAAKLTKSKTNSDKQVRDPQDY